MFGTETLFNKTATGLVDMYLDLYTKKSNIVKS